MRAAERAELDDGAGDAGDVLHELAQGVAVERLEGQPHEPVLAIVCSVWEFSASPIEPSRPASRPAPKIMSTPIPLAVR